MITCRIKREENLESCFVTLFQSITTREWCASQSQNLYGFSFANLSDRSCPHLSKFSFLDALVANHDRGLEPRGQDELGRDLPPVGVGDWPPGSDVGAAAARAVAAECTKADIRERERDYYAHCAYLRKFLLRNLPLKCNPLLKSQAMIVLLVRI